MPIKRNHRCERVAEQIQKELANILQFELKDPRMGMLTIVSVEVTRDLSHAKVFFSLLDKEELKETQQALDSANKFIRGSLASRMKTMRIVPTLHFHYDSSIERGNHLSTLIDKALAADKDVIENRKEDE